MKLHSMIPSKENNHTRAHKHEANTKESYRTILVERENSLIKKEKEKLFPIDMSVIIFIGI